MEGCLQKVDDIAHSILSLVKELDSLRQSLAKEKEARLLLQQKNAELQLRLNNEKMLRENREKPFSQGSSIEEISQEFVEPETRINSGTIIENVIVRGDEDDDSERTQPQENEEEGEKEESDLLLSDSSIANESLSQENKSSLIFGSKSGFQKQSLVRSHTAPKSIPSIPLSELVVDRTLFPTRGSSKPIDSLVSKKQKHVVTSSGKEISKKGSIMEHSESKIRIQRGEEKLQSLFEIRKQEAAPSTTSAPPLPPQMHQFEAVNNIDVTLKANMSATSTTEKKIPITQKPASIVSEHVPIIQKPIIPFESNVKARKRPSKVTEDTWIRTGKKAKVSFVGSGDADVIDLEEDSMSPARDRLPGSEFVAKQGRRQSNAVFKIDRRFIRPPRRIVDPDPDGSVEFVNVSDSIEPLIDKSPPPSPQGYWDLTMSSPASRKPQLQPD